MLSAGGLMREPGRQESITYGEEVEQKTEAQEMGSRWVSFLGMLSQVSTSSVAYKNSNPFSHVSEDRRLNHMCVV